MILLLAGMACAGARDMMASRYAQVVSAARATEGPGCTSFGSGLALGDGLVLTADHVLLDGSDLQRACHLTGLAETRVDVRVGAMRQRPAMVAAHGLRTNDPTMSFAGSSDYALLRVAVSRPALPRLTPCEAPPRAGQAVRVVLGSGITDTNVASIQTRKGGDDADYIDLDRLFDHGSSGAGVLDAATLCVLGLISHRFPEPAPTVTRMTPVAVFVADWMRARAAFQPAPR